MLGRRSQDDFHAEIRSHLQLEIDRLRAQGMSPEEAERTARRNFGNLGAAEDRFYHGRRWWRVEDTMRDLRHSWRALRRTPGFLFASVGTLALAMGAVAGMFCVVNAVLLKPLPYPNPDRLVGVLGTAPGSDMPELFNVGPEFYLHYKERAKTLNGIFVYNGGTSTLRTDHRVERIPMSWPTNDMYATLGVRPQLGRLPLPEDEDNVVLISDTLWTTWFNRDPAVVGQRHFVSDEMKEIIGVLPAGFAFPSDQTLLWVATPIRADQVRR